MVSFKVDSTLWYRLHYVKNSLVDPNRPAVEYPLIVKKLDDNIANYLLHQKLHKLFSYP